MDLGVVVLVCIVYRVVLMRGGAVRPGNAWFIQCFAVFWWCGSRCVDLRCGDGAGKLEKLLRR